MRKPLMRSVAVVLVCFAVLCERGGAECPMSAILGRRSLKQLPAPEPPLQSGFYDVTCPAINGIVADKVGTYTRADILTPGKLLRLFFHDCVAQGCDASILLNSTPLLRAEKDAPISATLDKFNVIDDIKAAAEAACPGIVSCADILAMAATYSIQLVGGPVIRQVFGRKDGPVSYEAAATASAPLGSSGVTSLLTAMALAGLDQTDLVVLSGAHTIGEVHCTNFNDRFGGRDTSTFPDRAFGQELYNFCTGNGAASDFSALNLKTFLDVQSPNIFDTSYYVNLIVGRGVLTSDQELFNDLRTQPLVRALATNRTLFFESFEASMLKMGKQGVLTGTQGVIRQQCSVTPV